MCLIWHDYTDQGAKKGGYLDIVFSQQTIIFLLQLFNNYDLFLPLDIFRLNIMITTDTLNLSTFCHSTAHAYSQKLQKSIQAGWT